MKRLALAMGLVVAFSSAAFASEFKGNSLTFDGVQSWTNGKANTPVTKDSRTLKLSASGTNWKGLAEFSMIDADPKNNDLDSKKNVIFTDDLRLDDWYFQTKEKPFTLEVWGLGEDQNNDYETPFEWVSHDDVAPGDDWAARVTTTIGGNETVFATMRSATPQYYAFYKQPVALGQSTSAGIAYQTSFDHNSTSDVWATTKVGTVTVTGEAAAIMAVDKKTLMDKAYSKLGIKGVTDSGLTVKAYIDQPAWVHYLESTYEPTLGTSRYQGIYKLENAGATKKTTTADVRFRASKDQAIGDIWNVDNDWFDLNDSGDNDWLKNKQWAYGANLVNVKDGDKNLSGTLKLYGDYVVNENLKFLASVTHAMPNTGKQLTTAEVRGWYQSPGDKNYTIHPRAFLTGTSAEVGVVNVYKINAGQVELGVWNKQGKAWGPDGKMISVQPENKIEVGYQLTF